MEGFENAGGTTQLGVVPGQPELEYAVNVMPSSEPSSCKEIAENPVVFHVATKTLQLMAPVLLANPGFAGLTPGAVNGPIAVSLDLN